ncbi:conserved hypothetical protein [Paecilomyces variotii No. 5]|uniref:MARVEL domain-containing protein n=1 Tax=Byssochlamys spectabilis (strain No. 5 / NBRC 109023) TaxID=1356009 RepID=V5G9T6_BYSSN|nr:conserved hypothetical protein [Paecilomyces variotii No. 5]
MLFLVLKIFRFARSQAKKRTTEQQQQAYNPQGIQSGSSNMTLDQPGSKKSLIEDVLHFFQLVMALVVIGLYGQDLSSSHHNGVHVNAKWVYAVITGGLAALTAFVYIIAAFVAKDRPLRVRPHLHLPLFLWQSVLCVLWLILFGIFGKMYIGTSTKKDNSNLDKMKNAVWIDIANLGLWVITGLWAGLRWRQSKKVVPQDTESIDEPEKEKAEVA